MCRGFAFEAARVGSIPRKFAERFDVEAVTDFLAIHILTHDRDSLDIDFWLYRDEAEDADDPRWRFIPWDKNLTFGAHYYSNVRGENDFFDYDRDFLLTMGNALVTKFLRTPALRSGLDARLAQLMNEVFDRAYFEDRIAALRPLVAPSIARRPDDGAFVMHPGPHQG
ncbi:MAG: CotH kinase family protein, partial [Bradymonadaceae bacterium]